MLDTSGGERGGAPRRAASFSDFPLAGNVSHNAPFPGHVVGERRRAVKSARGCFEALRVRQRAPRERAACGL